MKNIIENKETSKTSSCFDLASNDLLCRPSFRRAFAFPSKDTLSIPPLRALVKLYLQTAIVSVDPFARNCRRATFTNDLNAETAADFHLDALEFLQMLKRRNVQADVVIFDPPYSRRQTIECYNGIGRDYKNQDSQYHSLNWKNERAAIDEILKPNGVVISFGWHSNGMQQSGNYEIIEMLVVAHGGAHNDTICIVERKIENYQISLQFAA